MRTAQWTVLLFVLFSIPNFAEAAIRLGQANNTSLSNGLVGYWPLDGSVTNWSTGQTSDLSGQGNTGTLVSLSTTTSPVAGKIGQALKFDGNGSYITTANFADNPTNLTVSAWVKLQGSAAGNYIIVGKMPNAINGTGWAIFTQANNTTLRFNVEDTNGNNYVQRNGPIITDSKWHHLVGVIAGGFASNQVLFYVDGAPVSTVLSGGTVTNISNAVNVTIGRGGSDTNYYTGTIDDVRIYNRALGAAEVKQLYTLGTANVAHSNAGISNGLVGYWSMDGSSINWTTNQMTDLSGQNNTGQLISMSTTTSPVAGKIGQALKFAKSGQEVNVANNSSINLGSVETIAFWVKGTASALYENPVRKTDFTTGWALQNSGASNASLYVRVDTSGGASQCSNADLTKVWDGTWHHVVVVLNNGVCTPYKDGVAGSSDTYIVGGGFANPNVPLRIYNSGDIPAAYDDVRIYNRALGPTEVQQLYTLGQANAAHSSGGSNAPLSNGLVGYWSMDGSSINWKTNTMTDLSGQNNTGQLISMSTTTSPVAGKIGQALKFDGATGYVNLGDASAIKVPLPVTVSAWVKASSISWSNIVSTDGSPTLYAGVEIELSSSGNIGIDYGDDGSSNSLHRRTKLSATTITANQWYHVVGVLRGATDMSIYINGVDAGGTYSGTGGAVAYTTNASKISGDYWGNSFFLGAIDDVRVYNRALNAAEVQQLYTMGH